MLAMTVAIDNYKIDTFKSTPILKAIHKVIMSSRQMSDFEMKMFKLVVNLLNQFHQHVYIIQRDACMFNSEYSFNPPRLIMSYEEVKLHTYPTFFQSIPFSSIFNFLALTEEGRSQTLYRKV